MDAEAQAIMRFLSERGFHNKRIAALFDVNQGRVIDACNWTEGAVEYADLLDLFGSLHAAVTQPPEEKAS